MHPDKIGRYEIQAELGRGGMATVYRAYDPMFERDVAIKVLPRELLHDPQFKGRFEREAKIIARLEHAAIVPVYDVGDEGGQPYFVMRNMTGGALSDRMKNGPIALDETASILQRIGPALDYAHSKGIVHRDLKPGNILFDEAGEPYISDFGIAKLEQSQTNLTGSGIIGTPAYMSPEQAQGEEIDSRSDIYALGVILFEMLSGSPPFESKTPMGLVFKHVTEPIPHILDTNPNLPVGIEALLEKAMAKDPVKRIQNATTLAAAVTALANGETPDLEITIPAATRVRQTATGISRPATGQIKNEPVKQPAFSRFIFLGIGLVVLIALIIVGLRFMKSPVATVAEGQPSTTVVQTSSPVPADVTATSAPAVGLGGADKIALISASNVWVVDVDGSNPIQLTTDSQPKTNLEWLPDGSGLVYMQAKCAYRVDLASQKITKLACFTNSQTFEGFSISPDGKQVAIAIDRRLLIVPFDPAALSKITDRNGLTALGGCLNYSKSPVKNVIWSKDGKKVAILFQLAYGDALADTVRAMDISRCSDADPLVLDEFPGKHFIPEGYADTFILPSYAWNGGDTFLINTFKRNDGFGDLYQYDMSTGIATKINPINGTCCYRDARFSPDGKYIVFAYQDYSKGADSETLVYYIPFDQLGKSADLQPVKLPFNFFTSAREKPQFALRTVQP